MDVLSELAAVPGGDATVEQRAERRGHALHLLLHDAEHALRGAEVGWVAGVEEVRVERGAVDLALLIEGAAEVGGERCFVYRRDAGLVLQHGWLLRGCGGLTPGGSGMGRGESGWRGRPWAGPVH